MHPRAWILFATLFAPFHPRAAEAQSAAGPYQLEVTDELGRALPTFEHHGRSYVLGEKGQRYRIRVRNRSPRRVEAVISVDGRDVVDGKPASWNKGGHLIDPWGEVTVDGFRL